jgi:hypothetical protein
MEITKEELAQRYNALDDDSLIALFLQGSLTPLAQQVITDELRSRDISLEPNALRERYQEPLSTAPTPREVAAKAVSGAVKLVVFVAFLVAVNLILFGFGAYVAPLIWSSPIDKACQNEGYWYGSRTDSPEEIMCTRWWAIGGRRAKH